MTVLPRNPADVTVYDELPREPWRYFGTCFLPTGAAWWKRSGAEQLRSPDGRKILFVSNRDRNSEIYVMNADGSGLRKLTELKGEE